MKLRVGKRAQQQADKMDAWWAEHRPSAPDLFLTELEETLRHVSDVPGAGVPWPTPRRPNLRRILMVRTRTHVYFVVDARTETVQVHAIWGAPKARNPKL